MVTSKVDGHQDGLELQYTNIPADNAFRENALTSCLYLAHASYLVEEL